MPSFLGAVASSLKKAGAVSGPVVVEDAGLLASATTWYRLENNTESAFPTHNGSGFAGSYDAGRVNNCAVFNGSSDKVDISTTLGLTSSSTLSDRAYSLWCYPTAYGTKTIFSHMQGGSVVISFALVGGSPSFVIKVRWSDGTWKTINVSGAISLINNWYHVVVSIENSERKARIYINNAARDVYTLPATGGIVNFGAYNSNIGAEFNGTSSANYFTGKIDEVGVFNTDITPTQVDHLYNGGLGRTWPT